MSENSLLTLAADAILVLHVCFVIFIIIGLILIYLGHFMQWPWVKNLKFRILHLVGVLVVVLQSWLGLLCPLTHWEMDLREAAGGEVYSGSFIQHWLQFLLYYSAPDWVFITGYTVFAVLVISSWFIVRPNRL